MTRDTGDQTQTGIELVESGPTIMSHEEKCEDEQPGREGDDIPQFLQGFRLHSMTSAICLSLFLAALDITIVTTSLVSIADDLGALQDSNWIATSYLLSYTSWIVIVANVSDLFGRKPLMTAAVLIFIIFSAACAAAQSTLQLIIFRAFQGIGGAGIFAVGSVCMPEMVPASKRAAYNGLGSSVLGLSFLLGPLFGGAINDGTTWRWIFIINVPTGILALTLLLVTMPATFPKMSRAEQVEIPSTLIQLRKLDLVGFASLLAACVLFVCAVEEAGTDFPWSSSFVIVLVVLAAVFLIGLVWWQRSLGREQSSVIPVLPWALLTDRVLLGAFLTALCAGVPFAVAIITLPQRFEAVNQSTPLFAGIQILAFTLPCFAASALAGVFTTKAKIPSIFVISAGTFLQIVGLGLLYGLPPGLQIHPSIYGFQILIGFGSGLTLTTTLYMSSFMVEARHLAVTMGGITQSRILGGAIGIAAATTTFGGLISTRLATFLIPAEVNDVLHSAEAIDAFDPALQLQVRRTLSAGYDRQTLLMLCFACVETLGVLMMWEKKPRMAV